MNATDPLTATLPPGRHGLPREFVAENQRRRVLDALCEDLRENGYEGLTITKIVRIAHVSRRTLYEVFDGREGIISALLDGDVLVEAKMFNRKELATVKRFLRGEGS